MRDVVVDLGPVQLGQFLEADVDDVHAFASDPEVCRHTTWGPNTMDDTRRFLHDALVPQQGAWLLAVLREGQVIGTASVWTTSVPDRCGEMGYALGRPFWGRGYATLVAGGLLRLGVDHLRLERISATCSPDNVGSVRVLEKAGLRREGLLRGHQLVRGARRDSLVFGVLATD
ncbi:GNAT family N-acetyltransferase [Serinicoccus sp. LYQ131]|uniref:GNAT family N-acetyltransferase n=1 Tax=Serinicoccus sp. LYQ131 TaxID=3378797 RepID=UPI003853D509